VYRQYDHTVRAGTVVGPGSDAAVIRIKRDSLPQPAPVSIPFQDKIIALAVDCNATYVYLDPYEGGKIAVAEAARNLACTGAVPLGATDNLNFGNPHNPEIFYQLRRSVEGLAEGCRVFDAPITGGNVSLYNQNPRGPIDPTPTVAMVGLIEKEEYITTQWFKDEGDLIFLLECPGGKPDPLQGLGGSAYLQLKHKLKTGTPPPCDLQGEKKLHDGVRKLIYAGLISSAHDCSEGGLAVALAESCISRQVARGTPRLIGARIELAANEATRKDALLFGEAQGRIVVSIKPQKADHFLREAKAAGVVATKLGAVGGDALVIQGQGESWNWPLNSLHDAWWNSIARLMAS
jgi:phosphoribosylformylglycinamidine (FGAM) synthase-like enzyme